MADRLLFYSCLVLILRGVVVHPICSGGVRDAACHICVSGKSFPTSLCAMAASICTLDNGYNTTHIAYIHLFTLLLLLLLARLPLSTARIPTPRRRVGTLIACAAIE